MGASDLLPGDVLADGGLLDHFDAAFNGTNVEAETAANTIIFADVNAGAGFNGLFAAIGADVVGVRLNDAAVLGDEVDALMSGVVAGDVTEIATNTFFLVDASDRAER